MQIQVTGSSGLIGSEAVIYFDKAAHDVYGVDNNMRQVFLDLRVTPPGISFASSKSRDVFSI